MPGLWAKHHKSISDSELPILLGAKDLREHCFTSPWFRILPISVADAWRKLGRSGYRFICSATIHVGHQKYSQFQGDNRFVLLTKLAFAS